MVCFIFIVYRNNSRQCNYPQFKKSSLEYIQSFNVIYNHSSPHKITTNVVEKKRNMFQIRVHTTIPAMPTKFYLVYL